MARYYPLCRVNLSVVFDGFGGKDTPKVIEDIIPLSVNVHLNSYKEADTWEITFDAKAFPFSPELVLSGAVEIYLYQRDDLTQDPIYSELPSPTFNVNNLTGLAAYALAVQGANTNQREKLLVTGLIDVSTITLDSSGGVVSMSGRDYTALLLDREWDPTESGKRGRIPDGPLDQVVQQLVDEAVNASEVGRTLEVAFIDYEIVPETKGVAKTVTSKKVTIKPPPTQKSRSKRKTRGIAVKADSNYWDVIYKLCMSYGFISFVQGFNVYIAKPHVLQADQESLWGFWRVAYGRNLEKLEVERKLAKDAVPQIRVRSYSEKDKIAIEGRFPGDRENLKITGVGTKKEEYRVYTVPDISDVNTLKEIARSTYYTLARGEGVVRFSTPHLADLDNRDLLKMRAGDAVEIIWDAFNSEVMMNKNISTEEKVTELLSRGYKIDVARLVAEQYAKLDYFRQPFYVRTVNYSWDAETGVKVDVEAINFISAERDGKIENTASTGYVSTPNPPPVMT
jgi:hypothetical protein